MNSFLIAKVTSQSDNFTITLNTLVIDIAIKLYYNFCTSERLKTCTYLFHLHAFIQLVSLYRKICLNFNIIHHTAPVISFLLHVIFNRALFDHQKLSYQLSPVLQWKHICYVNCNYSLSLNCRCKHPKDSINNFITVHVLHYDDTKVFEILKERKANSVIKYYTFLWSLINEGEQMVPPETQK